MTTPLILVAVLLGVLGLAIGSFLNVVIYRVPRAESVVSPASHCPGCNTAIRARHNVPVVSWLALRARCASCRTPISARYPLVELGTGVLFTAITLRLGVVPELPAFLFLAAAGVALAMIDVDRRNLPYRFVLLCGAVAVALLVPTAVLQHDWTTAGRAAAGALGVVATLAAATRCRCVEAPRGLLVVTALVAFALAWLSWTALLAGVALTVVLVLAVTGASAVRVRTAGAATAVAPTAACLLIAGLAAVLVIS